MDEPLALPPIVDYATWSQERAALLPREKAHTREGDAIAAARRRLPMTEVDANITFVGRNGEVALREVFDGRTQLVLYKHMWHHGEPFERQCPGCTATIWDLQDASYLQARDITFAVLCEGEWSEISPFRDFMGYRHPWYSAHGHSDPVFGQDFGMLVCFVRHGDRVFLTYSTTDRGVEAIMGEHKLMDMTVFGRQEVWEDSPDGWPQRQTYERWQLDGRPVPQWTRVEEQERHLDEAAPV